jgi:hypothetical protein
MKIPFDTLCPRCHQSVAVVIDLNDEEIGATCACGHELIGSLHPWFTVGHKLLTRAKKEYTAQKDIPLSMVLSAMAFDCELVRLFCLWESLADLGKSDVPPTEEELDDRLRKLKVQEKIEYVCRLMHPAGLEDFVSRDDLATMNLSESGVKAGTLARDFDRVLFWPRNQILHRGFTGYVEKDASRAYMVALQGVSILGDLHKAKIASMEGGVLLSPPPR